MKKLLLLAAVAFFGTLNLNAQCSPDAQYTSPGIYPDSATNFSPACVNQPYTQLVTNVVPPDTTITVFGFPATVAIDSIVLLSVTGLPQGLTLACNPNGCAFLGGTTGCAIITGTATTTGTYNLVFNLKAYVGGTGNTGAQAFVLDYYKIVVGTTCTAGIEEKTNEKFKLSPNPASTKAVIEGLDSETIKNISLMNAEGKTIRTYNLIEGSSMEINMDGLNNGLYFVSINHKTGNEVLKLIKD